MTCVRTLPAIAFLMLLGACSMLPDWMGKEKEAPLPGERIAVLADEPSIAVDPTVAGQAIAVSPAATVSDWPQDGGNARNLMPHVALTGSGAFAVVQSARAGGGESSKAGMIPSPVVGGGMVFAMDAEGVVSAHDAANIGTVKWTANAAPRKDNESSGGGLAFADGMVYAVSGSGYVVAFDAANGALRWRAALEAPVRSAPKIDEARVYVLSADNQTFALSREDGLVLWKHQGIRESSGVLGAASPAVSGGAVIAAYSSGELYALRVEDGKEIWSQSLVRSRRTQASDLLADIDVSPIIDQGTVYATGQGGMFAALGLPNGQRLWDGDIAGRGLPALADNALFTLAADGELICLLRTAGAVRWVAKLPAFEDEKRQKHPILWTGPLLADGELLVFGSHGQLRRLSPQTGETLGSVKIPEGITTLPAAANGILYAVSNDATLYALK